VIGLCIGALAFTASAAATAPARQPAAFAEPTAVSAACRADERRGAACTLVQTFFRAVMTRRYAKACSLLGEKLRTATGGGACPRFIAWGVPEPMPWSIVGAVPLTSGVAVLVDLGQSELDRLRMRRHRAYVDLEAGRLKILDTRIVR
jgi:hypothetical protein